MQLSATAIIAADSAAKADEAAAMTGTWEGEKRKISRYAIESYKHKLKKRTFCNCHGFSV